jgi:peptide/nickel transport system permease protein
MAIAPAEFPAEAIVSGTAARALDRPETFLSHLLRHRLAQAGLIIIALLVLTAVCTPWLTRVDPAQPLPHGLGELGEPHRPGAGFPAGADTLGRDVWTRMLYGTRISLLVAVCAMLTAVLIGTTVGLLSGYCGGWLDAALMRCTEIVMSLPTILLAIALFVVLPGDSSAQRLLKLLTAIALVTWTGIARAVRGQVLSLKEQEFAESARAIGCSHARIIFVHLLPNVLPTIIVLATLATAHNILLEAGLSYLGQGIDPSIPSWGGMIAEGQPYILSAPWIILAPGIALVTAVVGFNLLGQGLQEVLEPRA